MSEETPSIAAAPKGGLKRSMGATAAGKLIYAICQWAVLAAIAKLADARLLGEFTLALAVTTPVVMMTNMGLRGALASDVATDHGFANYFRLRLLCCLTALVMIALVGGFTGGWEVFLLILLVGAGSSMERVISAG